MTHREQLEMIIEELTTGNRDNAVGIFHNLAVEKCREVYENLLSQDFSFGEEEKSDDDETVDDPFGSEMDSDDSDDLDVGDSVEDDTDDGDEEQDIADLDDSFELDDDGGDVEERVDDLETALQELQAEFSKMMAGEEGEEEPVEVDDQGDESPFVQKKDAMDEVMFEYVDQVGGKTYDKFAKMGDTGVNNTSIVASKNDMGGTAANIANAGTEAGTMANQGQLKGNGVFKGTKPKVIDSGNRNVVGGRSSKSDFTTRQTATTKETGAHTVSPLKPISKKST